MRHEAGHAVNYAFALYDRAEWPTTFGAFSQAIPRALSRRSILARLRAPHPRLVCAEASRRGFRRDVRGVDDAGPRLAQRVSRLAGAREARVRRPRDARDRPRKRPTVAPPTEDDLPVEAMHYTVAEHYAESDDRVPIEDERQFDRDLRGIFVRTRTRRPARARTRSFVATIERSCRASRTGRASRRAWCDRSSIISRDRAACARTAGRAGSRRPH